MNPGKIGVNLGRADVIDPRLDTECVDAALVDSLGRVRPVPAETLQKIDRETMRLWCHQRAVYLAPSIELIGWLRARIARRTAIEIGAGNGSVGRALGIPTTDNKCQSWPEVREYYRMCGQPTVQYPDDIEELTALDAVAKYRPQVVVACWVTHIYREEEPERGGNMYGIDEDALLESGIETYIHVGATSSHLNKRILSRPHEEVRPSWLFGRGAPEDRVIWVWDMKKGAVGR